MEGPRIDEGGSGDEVGARWLHGRRRRAVWRWWRHWWSRGRRAAALTVDHVLNVHEAALVRVFVDRRRRCRHEGVRAVGSRRQQHVLGALEGTVTGNWRPIQRAALAVDQVIPVYSGAHHVFIGLVEVSFLHRNGHIARPPNRHWRCWWRWRRRTRRTRRRRCIATRRRWWKRRRRIRHRAR